VLHISAVKLLQSSTKGR